LPLLLLVLAGCSGGTTTPAANPEEAAVRAVVAELQKALKDNDVEAIWKLLDGDTQNDADKQARATRERYARANEEDRKSMAERAGLDGAVLAELNGRNYFKSKGFTERYGSFCAAAVSDVTIVDDAVTINEQVKLVKADGKWKVRLPGLPRPVLASGNQPAGEDEAVWKVVQALQRAVKEKDYDAVWSLLDEDTRKKAEEVAKKVKEQYVSGDAGVRSELSERHGFTTGSEFERLDGRGYVHSKVFWYEIEDLPDSTFKTPAEIDGTEATVRYTEKGETKEEQLTLIKEEGKWKVEVDVKEKQ
jgi:hypothetical protein